MRQKYIIEKNEDNSSYIIKEFAEVDKDMFSLLCSEIFEAESLTQAVNEGAESVVPVIRTKNMYPPKPFAQKIAEALVELDRSEDQSSVEIFFDDKELIAPEKEEPEEETDSESAEIDELLEDEDLDEDHNEQEINNNDDVKNLTSSLKVAEDDSIATDEE